MMVREHGMYSIRTAWTDRVGIVGDARGGYVDGVDGLKGWESLTPTTVPAMHYIKILYIVF